MERSQYRTETALPRLLHDMIAVVAPEYPCGWMGANAANIDQMFHALAALVAGARKDFLRRGRCVGHAALYVC
jgi:hypothetical protein